jgi:hypothetical protein
MDELEMPNRYETFIRKGAKESYRVESHEQPQQLANNASLIIPLEISSG